MQNMDAGKRKHVRIVPVIFSTIAAICLAWALFVLSVFIVCYLNPNYMQKEFEKYEVVNELPVEMTMSEEDGIMAVSNHMMDFLLHGKHAEDLQIEVTIDGKTQPFFSERTLLHMMDVRDLFMISIRYAIIGAIVFLWLLGISRLTLCKDEPKIFRISTGIGMIAGTALVIIGIGAFCIYMVNNFDTAFIQFHHTFFNNDMWLLDPATDWLIDLLPEDFFFDTAIRIAVVYGIFLLLQLAGSIAVLVRGHHMKEFGYAGF